MLVGAFNHLCDCKTSRKLREPSFEALVATECCYISFVSADPTPAIESSTAQQQLITFTAKMLHSFWVSRSRVSRRRHKNIPPKCAKKLCWTFIVEYFIPCFLLPFLLNMISITYAWNSIFGTPDSIQKAELRMHISRSLLSFHSLMSSADQDQKIFNGLKKYLSSSENICPDGCKWRVMIRAAGRELGHGVNVKTE